MTVNDIIETENLNLSVISLNLESKRITSLEGIEKFSDLQHLELGGNSIEKISALPTSLRYLYLQQNKISSLKDASFLENLIVLDLTYNRLENLEGIENFKNLTSLYLAGNSLKSLNGIEHLKNLRMLSVTDNKLDSIEEILSLDSLQTIWFGGNKFADKYGDSSKADTLKVQLYRELHLRPNDDLRGAASIMDTGLFDFISVPS